MPRTPYPKNDYRYWVFVLEQFGITVPEDEQKGCVHMLGHGAKYGIFIKRMLTDEHEAAIPYWLDQNQDAKVLIRLGDGSVGVAMGGTFSNFMGTVSLDEVDFTDARMYSVDKLRHALVEKIQINKERKKKNPQPNAPKPLSRKRKRSVLVSKPPKKLKLADRDGIVEIPSESEDDVPNQPAFPSTFEKLQLVSCESIGFSLHPIRL
jgi:hypothetical protein